MKVQPISKHREALAAPDGRHRTQTPGLSLVVAGQSRRWIYRGNRKEVTLGKAESMLLEQAVSEVAQIRAGLKPATPAMLKRAPKPKPIPANDWTFRLAAAEYLAEAAPAWRGGVTGKNAENWQMTFDTYIFPVIGDLTPEEVTLHHVKTILAPTWATKAETSDRIRRRVEAVLSREIAMERRTAANPATKAVMKHVMGLKHAARGQRVATEAAIKQGRRGGHPAPSLPVLGAFTCYLYQRPSASGLAVLFATYTVARSGMVLGAIWDEIDFDTATWNIPRERMKTGLPFRQALSKEAIDVLKSLGPDRRGYVFKGAKGGPLSYMAPTMLIRGWLDNHQDVRAFSMHGVRTTFKDWTVATKCDWFLAEMSLSHSVKDKVAAAYLDSDALEARRPIMDAWGRAVTDAMADVLLA